MLHDAYPNTAGPAFGQDQPVRVLHSHPVWLPLTQTWMHNQVRFLPSAFENHVLCDETENLDLFPVARIHSAESLPRPLRRIERWARKTRRIPRATFPHAVARRWRPAIVHSHFGHNGWVDMPFVRAVGSRHVVTFYGGDLDLLPRKKPWWRSRFRSLLAHVDAVFCEGPFMAARVVDLGCRPDKVYVQHLGVDLNRLAFTPRTWKPGQPLRILVAASFREKKGLPYALEAIRGLDTPNEIQVTIVGDAGRDKASQAEKKRILALVRAMGSRVAVTMKGYLAPEVLGRVAREHHLFMQPSLVASDGDTEGGAPVAILEMAAMGLMVVATTHCDIPELLAPSSHHLLARERDVDGLTKALRWLLENPGAWAAVRRANREHIEAEFDALVQGERLGRLYERVLGEGRENAVPASG